MAIYVPICTSEVHAVQSIFDNYLHHYFACITVTNNETPNMVLQNQDARTCTYPTSRHCVLRN